MSSRLQQMRKAAGFRSAKAFAEHIGMSVSTYTSYEQNARSMTIVAAVTIADALDCTIDELIGRTPPKKEKTITLTPDQVEEILKAIDGDDYVPPRYSVKQ